MSKEGTLRIGIGQIAPALGETDENLATHLRTIDDARAEGVDLLVFPELSLSGYPTDVGTFPETALRSDSEPMCRLAEAAQGICVAVGFVEETVAAQFYNSCAVLRDGEALHIHRKLNLATYGSLEEHKYFAQGRYVDAFNLDRYFRVSTLICADAWNPALVHLAALHGATLLVVPTNSARDAVSGEFSNPGGWETVTRFYGLIYGMPIVMANRVGGEEGLSFWGGSRIVDPHGAVLAQAPEDEEALVVADVDYNTVRTARLQLPTVRDSNLALVHREISRLQQFIGVPGLVRPV